MKKEKCNWENFFGDLSFLFLAMVLANTWNIFNKGFSWLGLCVFISGNLFVLIMLYAKNTFGEKK